MGESADTMVFNPQAASGCDFGAFRVLAECRCAGGIVGGDFYALRQRGPNRLAVVIGDACGRGWDGAKLLPRVISPLRELSDSFSRPSVLLEELNRQVWGVMASDRFVTGAVLELDAEARTLIVSNAGHVPVMLRHAAGDVLLVGRASGPPLGILPDCKYEDESHAFEPGDVLVFMTDGVLEAIETDLTQMSTLVSVLEQEPGSSNGIYKRLLAMLPGLVAQRRSDDMTLMSLELIEARAATDQRTNS